MSKIKEPKKITLTDRYIAEIDFTKRICTLATDKNVSDSGKITYNNKVKLIVSQKALKYGAFYVGQQCNVTLTKDGQQVEAFYKECQD